VKDSQFQKVFVFCCSLVPAGMIVLDYFDRRIADTQSLMRNTGICTLIFLALSLAVTPLRRLTGKNVWSLFRRMLGLYAFFYGCLHVMIYMGFRHGWDVVASVSEVFQQTYVFFGAAAFLLMVPLAATSTVGAIKKMGNKKWQLLHRSVYLVAIAASVHYLLSGKYASAQKIVFASVFGVLLLVRVAFLLVKKGAPKARPAVAAKV